MKQRQLNACKTLALSGLLSLGAIASVAADEFPLVDFPRWYSSTNQNVQCGSYNNIEVAYPGLYNDVSPDFGTFMWNLRQVVWGARRMVFVDGKTLVCQVNWVRDHVHQSKAFCHWEYDLTSFLDFFLDHQREDGQFYELLKQMTDVHWQYVNPDCRVLFPNDAQALVRLELEADIEYLMVEGCLQVWRVTGDDAWLKKALPKLEKGIDYQTSSPDRWDPIHGLCKRAYTIDTWDFTDNPASSTNRTLDLNRPIALMHGDNTGVYQAMEQLAWINNRFGNAEKAASWHKRAAELKANMFKYLWNGKFFAHQVLLEGEPKDDHEWERLSTSNAYALNRGVFTTDQARSVIAEFQSRREHYKGFAEWFTIDPPYEPIFHKVKAGEYLNGAVCPFTAGELAKGAFENGYEDYAWDIITRLQAMVKRDGGNLYFLYHPITGEPQGRGPSAWGAAAILSAIDQGLAGIQDLDTQYRRIRFAPRWPVTPFKDGRYVTGYEQSHKHVDVRWTIQETGFRYRLESPAEEVQLHLMVPKGSQPPESLVVNGKETPFQLVKVGESLYVDALVKPENHILDLVVHARSPRL